MPRLDVVRSGATAVVLGGRELAYFGGCGYLGLAHHADVLRAAREGLELHPTVKPRLLLEDALIDVTNRGDIVVDCFAGSGSTLVAAEATGRRCRAIEFDGLYCDVIIRRWSEMT